MQHLFQESEVAKNSFLIASLSHEFHLTKMPSLFGLLDSFFATSYWTGEEFLLQMNYMWHNMDLFERLIRFNKYEILGPYVLGLLENMRFVSISLLLAEI